MLDDLDLSGGGSIDDSFDVLRELESNTSEEIRRQRHHFRIAIKAKVIVQPGNTSDMESFRIQGVTGDISEGGFQGLFPTPLVVGDIYRFEFDRNELDVPMLFARCVRCRLIREDAFECGLQFFATIPLPNNLAALEETQAG
jgi:hypothetical protein